MCIKEWLQALIAVLIFAPAAHGDPSQEFIICAGVGICADSPTVYWGITVHVKIDLQDRVGCDPGATYMVWGLDNGVWYEVEEIDMKELSFVPNWHQYYESFRVVPSSVAGCTQLKIMMTIARS